MFHGGIHYRNLMIKDEKIVLIDWEQCFIQSCNTISSFDDPLALDESISPSSKTLKSNEFKLPLILKEVAR